MKTGNRGQVSTTNLKRRFFLWSAAILIGGGLLLSALSFWNTRRLLMTEAMAKSEVILQEVEAIRSYVKKELRPKMFELHGQETFIIEAMSTTYVSTTIMERFARAMPDYIYRRASVNPHNPRNLADPFEEEMLDWFEQDSTRSFWQGIVRKKGKAFFISMVPDYFAPACIRCHGRVEDAPQSLIDRYGDKGGYRFKAGDLAGIDSVAVPVSASLKEAWQGSLVIFFITLLTTLVWLWLFNLLFQRLVIERLGAMVSIVSEKKEGEDGTAGPGDELDVLNASLGSLRHYVHSARKGASLQPNFIGDYVAVQPIAAGAMSWLYSGYAAEPADKVALKIGFNEVMQNPLYRACFETELQLFETITHPCLPKVRERVADVLVLEEIRGRSLLTLRQDHRMDDQLLAVFSQLCDLTASFHAAGVVHHDLRPQILMLDEDQQLQLIDMGLASTDRQQDPIAAAGLGPQGDLLYMAPEQIQGRRGDPRSDIYGIGVLLYLAATGHLPFAEERKSLQQWLQQKEKVTTPRNYRASLSLSLEGIILKAMSYDIKKRYQWVEDLWEDLNNADRK